MNILMDDWVPTDVGKMSLFELISTETGAKTLGIDSPIDEIGLYELMIGAACQMKSCGLEESDFDHDVFMQSNVPETAKKVDPELLIIESMGGNNSFHTQRGFNSGYDALLGLFVFQSRAVAGGRGYSPSSRGGGALSVINWGDTVYQRIQANLSEEWLSIFDCPRHVKLNWTGDTVESVSVIGHKFERNGEHPLALYHDDGKVKQCPLDGMNYHFLRHFVPSSEFGRTANPISKNIMVTGYSADKMKVLGWNQLHLCWNNDDNAETAINVSMSAAWILRLACILEEYSNKELAPRGYKAVKTDRLLEKMKPVFFSVIASTEPVDAEHLTQQYYDAMVDIYTQANTQYEGSNPKRWAKGLKCLKRIFHEQI